MGADILARMGHPLFHAWINYTKHGTLPHAGGYQDQPLAWLTAFNAMDMVRATFEGRHTEHYDMTKLTATQRALLTELENYEDGD